MAAAIERQTEAGVKQAEREAELYTYLSDIGAKLASGDFQYGRQNPTKGFREWTKASEDLQRNLINHFNEIMASGDTMAQKANRVRQMFQPGDRQRDNIRMDGVSASKIGRMSSSIHGLQDDVNDAASFVQQAEEDVRNFAEAFSISLTEAVEGATGAVGGLGGSAEGASARTQKSIEELNNEIKSLEEQKQKSFDPAEIAGFNQQIATLKREVDRLNGLGAGTQQVTGKIAKLNAEIKRLEEAKGKAYNVREIAEYNDKIAELKKEVENLNQVTVAFLDRKPLEPILLPEMKLIVPEIKVKVPDLKPYVSKMAVQMKAIRDMVKDELFGWAENISGAMLQDMMETEQIVKTYTDALVAKAGNSARR